MLTMKDLILSMVQEGHPLPAVMQETGWKKIDVIRLAGEIGVLPQLMENGRKPRVQTVMAKLRKQTGETAPHPARKVTDEQLRERVANGQLAKQIAIDFGMTTQAVYYRLRKLGLEPARKPKKVRMSEFWGMPMEEANRLRRIGATAAFTRQRQNARTRGIGWELTLAQWWDIWEKSGKWESRGRGAGGYVMGRPGDVGPYALGNVVICTHSENAIEREKHAPAFRRLQNRAEVAMDAR